MRSVSLASLKERYTSLLLWCHPSLHVLVVEVVSRGTNTRTVSLLWAIEIVCFIHSAFQKKSPITVRERLRNSVASTRITTKCNVEVR